jgi:Flp pilus assembly protein TadG
MSGREGAGQALVEFALSSLLFFTLVFFLVDGGRVLFNYITLAEAADDGARYAIVNSQASASAIAGVVQSNAVGISPTPSVSLRYQDASGHSPGTMVTVTATSGVTPLTGLFWRGLTITLQSKLALMIQN